MMSASEGEGDHGKVDMVREVAGILQYKSVPNADKGSKIPKILRMSLMDAPHKADVSGFRSVRLKTSGQWIWPKTGSYHGNIMGFIIYWDESLNPNPLFPSCQPVNNDFGL